jgi:prevent-host-death family protein
VPQKASPATLTYVRTYAMFPMMKRSATDLRAHLYEVLDHVAKTGESVEIVRRGVELCIVRKSKVPKKKRKPRTLPNLIAGDPDALIHMVWPWSEGKDL